MSAPSPRPKAFLGIGDYLLGELCVPLSTLTVYVIENNRFTKTRRLRKPYIARDDTLKHLAAKKTSQIGGNLTRKTGSFVIHRQQNALDLKTGVQGTPNTHEGIQ